MIRRTYDNRICKTDKGFTLVEVIICVSILAIASVILMQSMSLAAISNGKAQTMQNATSLAESVMEEVKSSSIAQLKSKYNGGTNYTISKTDSEFSSLTATNKAGAVVPLVESASTASVEAGGAAINALLFSENVTKPSYFVLCKEGVSAAHSTEKFNVTATIRAVPYSATPTGVSPTPIADASNANSIKLPVIKDIDAHTKTVLTQNELNKYDQAAGDFFYERNADAENDEDIKLASKEIIINKTGDGNSTNGEIDVKCIVVYRGNDGTEPNPEDHPFSDTATKYSKEVFNGKYVCKTDKAGNPVTVGNDIYIFYNRFMGNTVSGFGPEKITIVDTSVNDDDHHNVYLIAQNDLQQTKVITDDTSMSDIAGTDVVMSAGGSPLISVSTLTGLKYTDADGEEVKGIIHNGNYWLLTNFGNGSILKKEKKDRIYEVTVDVTKAGDTKSYATITSTVNVRE